MRHQRAYVIWPLKFSGSQLRSYLPHSSFCSHSVLVIRKGFLWGLWDRERNGGVSGNTPNTILGLSAVLGGEPDLERNVQAREMEGSCHQPPSSLPPGSVLRRLTKVSRKCRVSEAWVSPTLHLLGQGVCLGTALPSLM